MQVNLPGSPLFFPKQARAESGGHRCTQSVHTRAGPLLFLFLVFLRLPRFVSTSLFPLWVPESPVYFAALELLEDTKSYPVGKKATSSPRSPSL